MRKLHLSYSSFVAVGAALFSISAFAQQEEKPPAFEWPDGAKCALSLSFDDGRTSQVDAGLDLFERYGAKVTFYVTPSSVERRLEGWKRAVRSGHEIGNHSLVHPCSGNFQWSRGKALEKYTLNQMAKELSDANRQIAELLNVAPVTFAYPCGQTFVGRGVNTQSYVPVAARQFLASRGWMDEAPNDPAYCDLAQLYGMELDGKTFRELEPLLEETRKNGLWLVFGGHEIGVDGRQTTRTDTLERLLEYAADPANGIWLAPVKDVAEYVVERRTINRN